ncbi:MAG: phosphate/phosphite/phosphonate ABC transporter substrate-binding protein [bacterium]|nr:phosphate/phosphite/phosphonate ABC transporter substrate-binding protein [bacterium]
MDKRGGSTSFRGPLTLLAGQPVSLSGDRSRLHHPGCASARGPVFRDGLPAISKAYVPYERHRLPGVNQRSSSSLQVSRLLTLVLTLFLVVGITGCGEEAELGSRKNPVKLLFVPSTEVDAIITSARELGKMLEEKTGYHVDSRVSTSYSLVVEALGAGQCDLAFLNTFGYVLAHDKYGAEPLLVVIRNGRLSYRGQIIASANAGIETLEDLKGKRFAFVNPNSTSGYIYPSGLLRMHGIDPKRAFKETINAGSHFNVVMAVYQGQVDAGATFTDARDRALSGYPDVKEKVKVLTYTDKIPNDTVTVRRDLPPGMKDKLKKALLELARYEKGRRLMMQAYEITGFIEGRDEWFDPVRVTAKVMGLNIEEMVKTGGKKKKTPKKKEGAGK